MEYKTFSDKCILLVIDGFKPGGSQQVYLLLISEYVKIFKNVVLVVLESTESDLNLPKYENFQVVFLNSRKMLELKTLFKLKLIFVRTKPSYIMASMYRSQVFSALAKPLFGRLIWIEQNTYLSRTIMQWNLMKLLSGRCSKIINTSIEINAISRDNINKNKSVLKPNPINFSDFKDVSAGRNNDFIFIGRMVEQKNPFHVIQAFALFLSSKINSDHQTRLHMVGEGHLFESAKKLSVELGVDEFCIFHGSLPISDTLELLRTCKTLISCSSIEGFGLARLEALGAGCCVVTTNTGGVKDNLSELSNVGVFVSDESITNLVFLMEETLKADYWSRSSIEARIRFTKRFNPETISYEWISI
jgi:glycosyltransferase involved in cell wall biosynthesis